MHVVWFKLNACSFILLRLVRKVLIIGWYGYASQISYKISRYPIQHTDIGKYCWHLMYYQFFRNDTINIVDFQVEPSIRLWNWTLACITYQWCSALVVALDVHVIKHDVSIEWYCTPGVKSYGCERPMGFERILLMLEAMLFDENRTFDYPWGINFQKCYINVRMMD